MNRELDRHVTSVDPAAMQVFLQHSWPGNVRELQSAVKFALVHAAGDVLPGGSAAAPPQASAVRQAPPSGGRSPWRGWSQEL